MQKCWFILLEGVRQGPFSVIELKALKEITPDTLAWKEGLLKWTPIRDLPELKELFEESNEPLEELDIPLKGTPQEEAALSLDFSEPPFFLWLLFSLLVIIYVIFQLYGS